MGLIFWVSWFWLLYLWQEATQNNHAIMWHSVNGVPLLCAKHTGSSANWLGVDGDPLLFP